jgi:hypothetical protein
MSINPISQLDLEKRIYTIRGVHVMLDSDLAEIYGVPTSRLNEQVKRNIERFPEDFMFKLSVEEWEHLISQFATSSVHGGRRKSPSVFTEQGVAGLSGVLKSKLAIQVHVAVMRAFIAMRKIITSQRGLTQRIDGLERKYFETEQKFERVFLALEQNTIPTQGIFFDGQVFDAYALCSRIIRSANKRITLIDNYIDESTLVHLSKKREGVTVLLLTKTTNKQLQLDLQKANEQYGGFELKSFHKSHDRFLIIDDQEVYHLGASLKDLGKRWFAFSKLDKSSVDGLLNMI